MNKPTPIGSRVRVPHGIGTVTLYELLLRDTITYSDYVPHDVDYRLMVVLDPDHTWSVEDKLYAAWEKEATQVFSPKELLSSPENLSIDTWASTVHLPWTNRMQRGVRIIHKPTGIFVTEDSARSQHVNKALALTKLRDILNNLKDVHPVPIHDDSTESAVS